MDRRSFFSGRMGETMSSFATRGGPGWLQACLLVANTLAGEEIHPGYCWQEIGDGIEAGTADNTTRLP